MSVFSSIAFRNEDEGLLDLSVCSSIKKAEEGREKMREKERVPFLYSPALLGAASLLGPSSTRRVDSFSLLSASCCLSSAHPPRLSRGILVVQRESACIESLMKRRTESNISQVTGTVRYSMLR